MRIEIDQSGKLENTEKHTYLAYSNGSHLTIKISSVEKRKLQKYFRSAGKPRKYVLFSFATLIVILISRIKLKDLTIIIDKEYSGKDSQLIDLLIMLRPKLKEQTIYVRSIGKKSNSHLLAYGAAIKEVKPDILITAKEVIDFLNKKPGSA